MDSTVGTSLTPSEVVALRGDLFSPSAGAINSWKLAGGETKVSGPQLAANMFAAAFLGLEKAGDASLVPSKKKAFLGREVDTVVVTPSDQTSSWPAGSFEAKIMASARNGQAKGHNNIKDIVFDVLEKNASLVWDSALRLAHNGMANRGLLQLEAKKGLFSGPAKYTITPAASAVLAQAQPAEVQQLIQCCAKDRPAVSQLLNKEIASGFAARRKGDSNVEIAAGSSTGGDF